MICSPLASTRCRWASSRASRSSWSSGEPSGSAPCLYGSGSVVIGRRYPPATDLGAGTPLAGGACVRAQMTQMLCSPPGRRWVPPGRARVGTRENDREGEAVMKKVLELLLCILHPIAVVLIWINLVLRSDIGWVAKLTWGIAAIVPFVPFVYVLTGNDFL